jgi:hypothetical protein
MDLVAGLARLGLLWFGLLVLVCTVAAAFVALWAVHPGIPFCVLGMLALLAACR